jgi:acylphosphatase
MHDTGIVRDMVRRLEKIARDGGAERVSGIAERRPRYSGWKRVMNRHLPVTIQCKPRQRLRLDVTGAVQGVGFRPFVHRLAVSEGLGGFVRNTGEGACLEVEGPLPALDRFFSRLDAEIAPPAGIYEKQVRRLAMLWYLDRPLNWIGVGLNVYRVWPRTISHVPVTKYDNE